MSPYIRHTRTCTVEELQPALKRALRAYFLTLELTDVENQIILCCETSAERQKASGLAALLGEDGDALFYLAALVTPDWLIWARTNQNAEPTVVAARLKQVHVKLHTSVLSQDAGLDVEGFVEGGLSKVRGQLAFGPESAAQEFCQAAERANLAVNPPRRLLDIFGKTPS